MTMSLSLLHRAIACLPQPLQDAVASHPHRDEICDLIGEVWLALAELEPGEPLERAYARARARVRRWTQDPAHYAYSIDAADGVADGDVMLGSGRPRALSAELADAAGISRRTAQLHLQRARRMAAAGQMTLHGLDVAEGDGV